MKLLAQRIQSSPKAAKILEWGRLVTITGSAQVAVQALGFIGGILVIRVLPTQEYALYTLANTMSGTMLVLADGGISAGVMAQGGKVWNDREQLGAVLSTGLDLRRKFALISLLIAIPFLLYLLRHHNASWLMSFLIIASLIPSFFAILSGTLFEIAPKLHQNIIPLQRIQVQTSIGRLLLLSLTIFLFPWSYIAVLAAGIPQIWANVKLKIIADTFADSNQLPDPVIRHSITNQVKRLFPDAIYYCVSSQFTVWLISIYGSTAAVAQQGALGRFAVALGLFTTIFAMLIIPRFSRLAENTSNLFKHYVSISIGLILLALLIVIATWILSPYILWILGSDYKGLDIELILMMTGRCISLAASSIFFLCISRTWVINPITSISIGIASILLGVFFIDTSSLKGIFILDIFTSSIQLLMHFIYGFIKISNIKNDKSIL